MRSITRFLSALAASCLLALPAHALVMPPTPEGTCPLDNNQAPDRNALAYMHLTTQTPATLKALFAECSELERVRSGRQVNLTNYGAIFEQKDTLPVGVTPEQTIAILGTAAGLSGTIATKSMNAAELVNNPAVDKTAQLRTASLHSILKQTPKLLILANEQRHLAIRLQYGVAAVTALTVVKGRIVAMNFYAPLRTEADFGKLGLVAESYANSLIAANQ